jgi:hypothetical protein
MARPPKAEAERKNVDLRIPVTSEQKDVILQVARLSGLEMATWARPLLLKEAHKQLKKAGLEDD